MALVAPVKDGQLLTNGTTGTESTSSTNSTGSASSAKKSSGSTLDKEAFLQLLVAQMKYQDPLQPTSNTEYISQYAQFSQVESLQNVSSSMDLQRASALVGKEVYVQTTTSSGETKYIQGMVDYVSFEGGKPYVYINEEAYPLDEVQTIVDPNYLEAYDLAMELVTGINKLPNVGGIDLTDGDAIDELQTIYEGMTDYQKTFVAKEKVTALQEYIDKLAELRKLAAESAGETAGTAESGETASTEEAGSTESAEETESTESA